MTDQQTATRFSVGQHVRITTDDRLLESDLGTIIEVIQGDDGAETACRVLEFKDGERDVEKFTSSQIEADDSGFLDIDSLTELRAEVQAIASSRTPG